MLKVASNFELDYVETQKEIEELNKTLFAHAKLQYCFENYLNKITQNNNVSILACLTSLYAQIIKIQREKRPYEKITDFYRTKWYKYVREAMIEEESFDIKNYSTCSMQTLSETLFNMLIECQFYLINSTDETMLTCDKKNLILEVFVLDENNDFENFKQEKENEVQLWLDEVMHERWELNE